MLANIQIGLFYLPVSYLKYTAFIYETRILAVCMGVKTDMIYYCWCLHFQDVPAYHSYVPSSVISSGKDT